MHIYTTILKKTVTVNSIDPKLHWSWTGVDHSTFTIKTKLRSNSLSVIVPANGGHLGLWRKIWNLTQIYYPLSRPSILSISAVTSAISAFNRYNQQKIQFRTSVIFTHQKMACAKLFTCEENCFILWRDLIWLTSIIW